MGIPHFTLPLTMREAARFIGVNLEAMYPHRDGILIGYNSPGPRTSSCSWRTSGGSTKPCGGA